MSFSIVFDQKAVLNVQKSKLPTGWTAKLSRIEDMYRLNVEGGVLGKVSISGGPFRESLTSSIIKQTETTVDFKLFNLNMTSRVAAVSITIYPEEKEQEVLTRAGIQNVKIKYPAATHGDIIDEKYIELRLQRKEKVKNWTTTPRLRM